MPDLSTRAHGLAIQVHLQTRIPCHHVLVGGVEVTDVATEDVAYLLQGLGIETGIDLATLAVVGDWISSAINRPNGAKAGRALCARTE